MRRPIPSAIEAEPQRHRGHRAHHGADSNRSLGEVVEMQKRLTCLSPSANYEYFSVSFFVFSVSLWFIRA